MLANSGNEVYAGGCGGYGGFGGGYGGWGGIAPIGLFGVFGGFGNRGFGDGYGREGGRDGGLGCCCDVRADIGSVKYDVATTGFQNALSGKDNTFQIEKELFGLQRDILTSGAKTALENCQNTNALSNQIASCCCENQKLTQQLGYETQIRDLQNTAALSTQFANCCCDLKREIEGVACLVRDTAKGQERDFLIRELKEAEDKLNRLALLEAIKGTSTTAPAAAA